MHPEAVHFLTFYRLWFSQFFYRVLALDVGSGDINGTNRSLFKDSYVLGNDVAAGPNVDIVCATKDLPFRDELFDIVISSECFEHDPDWQQSMLKIMRLLKEGGMFIFTCATTGRAEHGTRRTTPKNSLASSTEHYQDYYGNIDVLDFYAFLIGSGMLRQLANYAVYINQFSHDLYFVGFKRTNRVETDNHILIRPYEAQFVTRVVLDPEEFVQEKLKHCKLEHNVFPNQGAKQQPPPTLQALVEP